MDTARPPGGHRRHPPPGREPVVYDESLPTPAQIVHIVANSPAAALRRIEADRALLKLHGEAHECAVWDRGEINGFAYVPVGEHCSTVLILAEQHAWTDLPTCGAKTVFWPEAESCDAECSLRPWHEGKHRDTILGEWPAH